MSKEKILNAPENNQTPSGSLLNACVRKLQYAQRELDLLYCHAISTGICKAGNPPHKIIKEFLESYKLI